MLLGAPQGVAEEATDPGGMQKAAHPGGVEESVVLPWAGARTVEAGTAVEVGRVFLGALPVLDVTAEQQQQVAGSLWLCR